MVPRAGAGLVARKPRILATLVSQAEEEPGGGHLAGQAMASSLGLILLPGQQK